MKLLKNREVLFQTSITETLLLILFFSLLISSISNDKVIEQEKIIEDNEEVIKENEEFREKFEAVIDSTGAVNIDSLSTYVKDYSYYHNENIILNEFLDSLAQGKPMEEIHIQIIEENAALKEELEFFEDITTNNEDIMIKNQELKNKEIELAEKEKTVKALQALMANSMKAGESDGNLDPEQEEEQAKQLIEAQEERDLAKEEKNDLEDQMKEKEEELQEKEKELAALKDSLPKGSEQDLQQTNDELQKELERLQDLFADKEMELREEKTRADMGENAPSCSSAHGIRGNPYLFQLDFKVQCPPKKNRRTGKNIAGTKDCESNKEQNAYFIQVKMFHRDSSWLVSKTPGIVEGDAFYQLSYTDELISVGGQATKTHFKGLSPLMKRLDGIKKSRFINTNDPFCQDSWKNQVKGYCRECTYSAYLGEVDEELTPFIAEISDIIDEYVFFKTGWMNDPDSWVR